MTGHNTVNSMGITPYLMEDGEDYMSNKQLAHLEKILLSWRQALLEEAGKTVTHMKEGAINPPDVTDCASLEEEFSLKLRTRDRERKLIKKINDALSRLRKGDFGYCDTCGIEIGLQRLEARPTATLCIDCKTLSEIKEKQGLGNTSIADD